MARKDLDSQKLIRIVEKLNGFGIKTKFTYTYNPHSSKLSTESLKAVEGRKGLEDFLEAYERGEAQPLYFDVYKDSETPFTIVVTEYEDFLKRFVVGERSVAYQDTPWDKIVIFHKGHPMAIPDPMDEEKIDYIRNALSILPEEARVSRAANGTVFDADNSRIVKIPPGIPNDEEAFLATSDVHRKTLVFTKKREKDSFGLYLMEDTRLHKIEEIGFSALPRIAVFPNGIIIKLPEISKSSNGTKGKYGVFSVSSERSAEKNEELSGELESLFRRYGRDGENWAFTTIKTLDFGIDGMKLYLAGITNGSGGILRYAVSIDDGSLVPKTGLYLPDYGDEADFLANAMGDGLYYMLYHRYPSKRPTVGYSGMRLFGKDRPLREVIVKNGNEKVECFFHGKNETAVFVSVLESDIPGSEEKRGEKPIEFETSDFLVPYSYIKEIAEKREGGVVLELDTLRERFAVDMKKTVSRHLARGERYEPLYKDSESGIALFRENPYYNGPYCFYDSRKVYTVSYKEILSSHSQVEVSGSARGMESIPKETSHLALMLPPDENGVERMVIFARRASFPNGSMSLVAVFEKSKLGLDENEEIFNFLLLENGKKKGIFVLFSSIPDKKGFNIRMYEFSAKGENGEISVAEIGRDSTRYLDPLFQIDEESKKIYLSVIDRDGRRTVPIETDASFLFGTPDETNDTSPNP